MRSAKGNDLLLLIERDPDLKGLSNLQARSVKLLPHHESTHAFFPMKTVALQPLIFGLSMDERGV